MHVAVYGTLRYGGSANGLLRDAEYIGSDHILGRLYNLGSYPGLHLSKEDDPEAKKIVVDVYKLPNDCGTTLAALDRYEGYHEEDDSQSLYLREPTMTQGGLEVQVYEYNANARNISEITSGDWFDV